MTNKECCVYYPKCNCPALLSRIKQLEELGDRAFLVARDADSAQKAAFEMLAAMEAKFHGANGSLVACRQREDKLIADLSASRQECAGLREQGRLREIDYWALKMKLDAMEITGIREVPSAQALLRRAERAESERDAAIKALKDVVALSDRKHDAWDAAHAIIDGAELRASGE